MSSNTWTPAALSSNARAARGTCWRAVEAQHHVSTAKLTDTAEEQRRLEELIEANKPTVPVECRHLHYLLFTPFRYGAPYPRGSRFRRAGMSAGVFYGAVLAETAVAELAFARLLFFAESAATPWPTNPGEYTAFAVAYAAGRALDLTLPPFSAEKAVWSDPTNYGPCQSLADAARAADVDLIRYQSARCRDGINLAILTCRCFAQREPSDRQSWHIQLSAAGARLICESPKIILSFGRDAFANDPHIAAMPWDR